MTVSLRLSDEDAALIRNYAQLNGMTLSELVRKCVLERIEDEYDLAAYHAAMKEFRADPETISLSEMKKELGLE